jgi:c-di-GMP-binding flagellar brake protein YcgR
MDEHTSKYSARAAALRDRRYAIRFPFAADVEMIDLETGARADGVTSDLSLGGCFVCSSKPLKAKSRVRVTLTRKGQSLEALGVVRIVKPRIGMGVEFIDVEEKHNAALTRWLDQLRREY